MLENFSVTFTFELKLMLFSRGLSVVPDEEVIAMYDGSHVPLEQMSDFYGKVKMPTAI